ncbi:TRAP transporter large permease [Paenirhodobacter populi]|uniref:TRAP transporter large permease protein n=1 Tax=Paenirhodobacter populi TaxID=2306993 RepID=A0A443IQ71_9RHOB|nr:TRAP transporter large permease [Sinirhodobacter populi]RWR08923.1 TRAP transporter large permease [Sinirhodobacter populi]RWR30273.1 TRAP transporter large permease [Sinirhodobacter populi]
MIPSFSLVGLFLLGVPISVALALTAVAYIVASGDAVLLDSLPQQLVSALDSYGLLALPLFILLGEAMAAGGAGRRLVALASSMVGPVRGGLAYVSLIANVMLAAILGSTVAQLTVMTRMVVPEMEKAGYPRQDAVAITAAGAMLAPVFPPSMMFILYGVIAQVPIGDLFVAGLVPGVLMALSFFAVIALKARRVPYPRTAPLAAEARRQALIAALPSAAIPVFIVLAIATGLATPTEAGGLAAILALVLGLFVHREMRWRDLGPMFTRAAMSSAVVLFLVAAAQLVGWVLAYANLPAQIGAMLAQAAGSPVTFMLLLNVILIVIGTFLEPIPALLLVVPVTAPLAAQYGIDPVHLGLVISINLSLGLLTPPVGAALFAAASLSGLSPGRVAQGLMPYLAAAFAVLIVISIWPFLL